MALRQLMIAREMQTLRAEQDKLTEALTGITERRTAWKAREANAEKALEEINDESTAEERAAFDAEAAEIDAEDKQITADEEANTTRSGEIATRLAELQTELDELNKRGTEKPKTAEKSGAKPGEKPKETYQREGEKMEIRDRVHALMQDESMQKFVTDVRAAKAGNVSNAELTIPTVMLPLLRELTNKYSKLLKYVRSMEIKGDAKQNILGSAPEAVWTDTVGRINLVEMNFLQIPMSGHKLGAAIAIPNPYLEDSDEDLAVIIVDQLGQANGLGWDKAIVYGTGVNCPMGIATRLALTSEPDWWGDNYPTFTDLHTSNIGYLSGADVHGVNLFTEMATTLGKAKEVYAAAGGGKFWAMNSGTYAKLQMELIAMNAAGSLITPINAQMPVIGGAFETLEFIPDNVIIGGYGSQYLAVIRKGLRTRSSTDVRFLEDQTVFAGTSRGDGFPVAGEGFAMFTLATSSGATSVAFAEDKANPDDAYLTALSGTGLTLSPEFDKGTLNYTASVASSVASTTITATPRTRGTVESIKVGTTEAVSGVCSLSAGVNVITIKVKYGQATQNYTITVTKAGS